jgi:hypothetical protein
MLGVRRPYAGIVDVTDPPGKRNHAQDVNGKNKFVHWNDSTCCLVYKSKSSSFNSILRHFASLSGSFGSMGIDESPATFAFLPSGVMINW